MILLNIKYCWPELKLNPKNNLKIFFIDFVGIKQLDKIERIEVIIKGNKSSGGEIEPKAWNEPKRDKMAKPLQAQTLWTQ